jgi:molybdate transport system substrate-binding protein
VQTLLAAKSIVYTDPALGSPSGVHFAQVLERLGIAEEMKAKSKLHNGVGFNAEFVARGEIELAIQQISEIVPVKGVEPCRASASRPATHDRVCNRNRV